MAVAQDETQYRFQNHSLDQGLSQSTVYTILQDSKGFLWAGTRDGLNRFDGYSFEVWKQDEELPGQFTGNSVRAILEAPGYRFWIGTGGRGVFLFDPVMDSFLPLSELISEEDTEPNPYILDLAYDRDGGLWIATRENGLFRYDRGTESLTSITLPLAPGLDVWTVTADSDNRIFAGTDDGLFLIEPDGGITQLLQGHRVVSAVEGEDGNLWIATYREGVYLYDEQTGDLIRPQAELAGLNQSRINTLFFDAGRLWIGTADNGAFVYHTTDNRFVHLHPDNGNVNALSDQSVRTFYRDRSGVIWVGTNTSGLDSWSAYRHKFSHIRQNREAGLPLSNSVILSFVEQDSGDLWAGTGGGGINVFNNRMQLIDYYRHDPGQPQALNNDQVITMLQDNAGRIWVGTDGGGLNLWMGEGNRFTSFLHEPEDSLSISDNSVLTLLQASDGFVSFPESWPFESREKPLLSPYEKVTF